MRHRLVHVEGMPGSGKSTTSQYIYLQLLQHGVDAAWIYEEQPEHPVRVAMKDCGSPQGFRDRYLACWRRFVEDQAKTERVTIFESALIQSAVEQMRYAGMPEAEIRTYFEDVLALCAPLHPALIQVRETDAGEALRRVCDTRGEGWAEWFVGWNAAFPYAERHGHSGFEGLVACYREFGALNDALIDGSDIRTLRLLRNPDDWEGHNRAVLDFLGIKHRTLPALPAHELSRYVGLYEIVEGPPRNGVTEHAVRLEGDSLVVDDFWFPTSKLLYKEPDAFYIEGSCVELHFESLGDGSMKMTMGGTWRGWITERVMRREEATGGPA